jgi:hypothetical protein
MLIAFFAQPLLLFEKIASRFGVLGLKLVSGFGPAALAVAMSVELGLAATAIVDLRAGVHSPLLLGLTHLCRIRL